MKADLSRSIAAAVVATIYAAPFAAAQTQSNVKISGYIDLSLESVQTGKGTFNRMSSGQLNQSRLNFTGAEDLGGGSRAFFELQAAFSPDTGVGNSAGLFARTALVGLTNDRVGTLKIGRLQTLSDEALGSFWGLRWGASANYFLYYGGSTQLTSNAVRYESPSLAGFSVAGQYALDEGGVYGSVAELGVKYLTSNLLVNGAYYRSKSPHEFLEKGASVDIATLGISYDFGFMRPSVVTQRVRTRDSVANKADKSDVALSTAVPLGRHQVWLDYGWLKDRARTDADARAASVRLDYNLSKRTFIYTGIARIWNGKNAYYQPMGASGSYPTITSPSAVQTGNVPGFNGNNTRSVIAGIRTSF